MPGTFDWCGGPLSSHEYHAEIGPHYQLHTCRRCRRQRTRARLRAMTRVPFRRRLQRIWATIRRKPPENRGYGEFPPDFEDAFVPTGPRRTPPLAGEIALPLPDPEVRDVDAFGRPLAD